jgi:hypothetical protein
METRPLTSMEQGTTTHRIERRDCTTRALRNAVAAWFSIHPARLSVLTSATVERMALRLEGRRPQRRPEAGDIDRVPVAEHPWAG